MAHIIISVKRNCDRVCNLDNYFFASVVAKDSLLSVWRVLVDSEE